MSAPEPVPLRIATRASALALWQANHVAALLKAAHPGIAVEIVHVTTTGDRDQAGSLRDFGGLGVFTREVQRAVLDGRAELAVHSLKDLPTESAAGLRLAAVPLREETADALVLPTACDFPRTLEALPPAARVGTGSLRRRAQLLALRPDLRFEEARGNVETRVRKLDEGQFDALVLAVAGLKRLGLESRISMRLEPPLMYAAVGQGALGIECREDDAATRERLAHIEHAESRARVAAERAMLAVLGAGCHAPVGAATFVESHRLTLEAAVLSADGRQRLVERESASDGDATRAGEEVARRLLAKGAGALIAGR